MARQTYQERVAQRQTRNQADSEIRYVFTSQIKKKIRPIFEKYLAHTLSKENIAKPFGKLPIRVSTYSIDTMMKELRDDQSTYLFSVYLEWDDSCSEDGDTYEKFDHAGDQVNYKALVSELNRAIGKNVFKASSSCEDDSYYVELFLDTGAVRSMFTSFDSFMMNYMMEPATEGYGEAAKNAIKGTVYAGATVALFATKHPCIGFCTAIASLFNIALAYGEITQTRYERRSKKNPTDAEKASLDVFKSKYAPMIQQQGAKLQQILHDGASEYAEDGFILETPNVKPRDGKNPYMQMGFVAGILKQKEGPALKYRERSEKGDELLSKLRAFAEELDDISNGNLELTQMYDSKKKRFILTIEFTYLDRDGIILPNLR